MSYLKNLMEKIYGLNNLHDFVFVAGKDGQKVDAHRNVIEAACTNFYGLVNNDSFQSKIVLNEINGEMLQATIGYIYSGNIELTLSNVHDFVYIASILGIISLQQKCTQFLIDNLSFENCVKTLTAATNCDDFELFGKSWKFICETFEFIPFSKIQLFPSPEQIESKIDCDESLVLNHILQCFYIMESRHAEHIPSALESIRLNHIPSKFLSNVMAPLLAKYNLTNSLLNEYCRRSLLDPLAKKQNARTSSQTSDGIYCAHFSSTQKILIVQKYNSISNGWDDVKSLSCVSTCIRYIVANGKLFIICDQDHMDCIRIVESYDLNSFDRSVYSRVMSWRAGFRPIAVDDYIYMLGGVGWHCDSSAESSIGSLERLYTKNWDIRNAWESCESMPVSKFRYVTAELDGRIYVAGGDNDGIFSDQFHCYDTKIDKWTELASIRLQSTNAFLFKSKNFLYGIDKESILHKYNSTYDHWTWIGPFRDGETIIHTTECRNETYAICKGGKFGIIEINDSGGYLNTINEMSADFDPCNPPILFVN